MWYLVAEKSNDVLTGTAAALKMVHPTIICNDRLVTRLSRFSLIGMPRFLRNVASTQVPNTPEFGTVPANNERLGLASRMIVRSAVVELSVRIVPASRPVNWYWYRLDVVPLFRLVDCIPMIFCLRMYLTASKLK